MKQINQQGKNASKCLSLIVENIWSILFISIYIFLFLLIIRAGATVDATSYNDICMIVYGNNWSYSIGDKDSDTCVTKDYITLEVTNRKELNISKAYEQYCPNKTKFFDLSKWNNGCNFPNI